MTEKEYQTYMFLVNYIKKNGFSPSVREIAEGISVKSTSTVVYRLHKLEKLGKIKIKIDTPRAISVVGYQYIKVR